MFAKTRKTAADLATQVATDFPPSLQNLTGRKALEMYQRTATKLRRDVLANQKSERLGLIRRIVFARTLQRELVSLGYHGAIVKQLISEVLTALTFGDR